MSNEFAVSIAVEREANDSDQYRPFFESVGNLYRIPVYTREIITTPRLVGIQKLGASPFRQFKFASVSVMREFFDKLLARMPISPPAIVRCSCSTQNHYMVLIRMALVPDLFHADVDAKDAGSAFWNPLLQKSCPNPWLQSASNAQGNRNKRSRRGFPLP